MLRRLRQRLRDMQTIKTLFLSAERHANAEGQQAPGVEHFILAALELPDGSARKAFERIGANPEDFKDAIAQQYRDALKSVGIDASGISSFNETSGITPNQSGLFKAKPAIRTLMLQMLQQRKRQPSPALLSAHVIVAATTISQGIAVRALNRMGIDLAALDRAAQEEIDAVCTR